MLGKVRLSDLLEKKDKIKSYINYQINKDLMPRKEFENLPIRSYEDELNSVQTSIFEIGLLKEKCDLSQVQIPPHRHDYYHIMFIKNGRGQHTIDFKTYDIQPNSIFFVSPGQVHSLTIDSDAEGYVISFNSSFYLLKDNFEKLIDFPFFHSINNAPYVYLNSDQGKIQTLWEDIYEEFNPKEKHGNKVLRALLELLLIRISSTYSKPIIEDKPTYLTYQIRKLETLVDLHFKTHRVLNDYAELMHISSTHLNSICKKALNKTVKNLIHERQLIEAKRLLLFTNNSIAEIAYELGFTDKSYFMRFFKKQTSVTADTYRQMENME